MMNELEILQKIKVNNATSYNAINLRTKQLGMFNNFMMVAIEEGKRDVLDDVFTMIESLITVDAQLQHQGWKIEHKGKTYHSLTEALRERLDEMREKHLNTQTQTKR